VYRAPPELKGRFSLDDMNMNITQEADAAFIESPNTVDFGTRESDLIRAQIDRWPFIRLGKILTGNFAAVYVPQDRVQEVLEEIGPNHVTIYPSLLGLLGRAELDACGILAVQQQPYLDLHGNGVLVGFVDTGIDYRLPAFQFEDGSTKIKYIWDQTISGLPPLTFNYGSEFDEGMINEALRSPEPLAVVPHEDMVGHGTFLASATASHESGDYLGAVPEANIIAVKLRKAQQSHLIRDMAPPDQENAFSSVDVMVGVEYIVQRAMELNMPVAVCIGLGSNFGSHDGNSFLEDYLSRVGDRPGSIVCIAAGNEAAAGHHTMGTVAKENDSVDIQIRCEGTVITTGINMQIWNNSTDRLSVSITSPTGETLPRIPAKTGTTYSSKLILERSTIQVQYYFPNPKSGSQMTWIKIFDPTPGIWVVTVYGDIILEGSFHAWMPITGMIDPGIQFVRPEPHYTVTSPGTAIGPITVGAYEVMSKNLYSESSWGPTRLPNLAPELMAPGVDAAGIYPSGYGTMSGTSVAAAFVTGACALMLEWGIVKNHEASLNTFLIKAYFIRGCGRDAGMSYPNDQWGYGRLDLLNTFISLR
jgi:subtilisin family serine protease